MGTSSKNAPLWVDEQGVAQASRDLVKDRPSLLLPHGGSCFRHTTHSSSRGRDDEDLSPLLHENAELKAEQSSLILKNSELLSRTLLLKLENQRLKEQLERQMQKTQFDVSSSVSLTGSSSLSDDDLSDTDNEEFDSQALEASFNEVKLAHASGDMHSP